MRGPVRLAGIGLCLALSAAGAIAQAEERRAAFQLSASVVRGCVVSSAAAGSWGDIDLGTRSGVVASTASGTLVSGGAAGLRVDCTPGADASLSADMGQNAAAGTRRLAAAGGGRIAYTLYVDGGTAPWAGQAVTLAFPVGTQRRTVPLRAEAVIPAGTAAGSYRDTVRLTISF